MRRLLALGLLGPLTSVCLAAPPTAGDLPTLRCQIESDNTPFTLDTAPTQDPYAVKPVTLNERFRFKAVVVADASGQAIDHVKLYTQEVGEAGRLVLHQVSYSREMVAASFGQPSLTGVQWVYARRMERQFQFECHWIGGRP